MSPSSFPLWQVYGVAHKCEFLCGDFFQLAPSIKVQA